MVAVDLDSRRKLVRSAKKKKTSRKKFTDGKLLKGYSRTEELASKLLKINLQDKT